MIFARKLIFPNFMEWGLVPSLPPSHTPMILICLCPGRGYCSVLVSMCSSWWVSDIVSERRSDSGHSSRWCYGRLLGKHFHHWPRRNRIERLSLAHSGNTAHGCIVSVSNVSVSRRSRGTVTPTFRSHLGLETATSRYRHGLGIILFIYNPVKTLSDFLRVIVIVSFRRS